MANYTISGTATYPDGVTELDGTWTLEIYTDSGVVFDGGSAWRGGRQRREIEEDGTLSWTLPQTDGTYLYKATFHSRDLSTTLGPFVFDLTANRTWQSVITAPTMVPVTPADVTLAQAARVAAEAARDEAITLGAEALDGVYGRVYTPEDEGAIGDGVADDTAEINAALAAAGADPRPATVLLTGNYLASGNLFVYGTTNVVGTGTLILNSNLTPTTKSFWINAGISAKGVIATPWTGRWEAGIRATANVTDVGRLFQIHRCNDVTITAKFDHSASIPLAAVSIMGSGNDAAWCLSPSRSRIRVHGCHVVSGQSSATPGGEGISISLSDQVWLTNNYVHGVGDDPLALHSVTDYTIANNRAYSRDGRIFVSDSRRGHVHDNYAERIANPDATYASGGSLMHFDHESPSTSHYANADARVHDNTLVHAPTLASGTYGIRLRGVRRFDVHDNHIVSTSANGFGITWEGVDLTATAWADPEALEVDSKARCRDLSITNNRSTGGGHGGIREQSNFTGQCAGYLIVRGNTPGTGGESILSPTQFVPQYPGTGRYKTGIYHASATYGITTGVPVLGTATAQPIILDQPRQLTELAIEVTTAGAAGAVQRLGVYTDEVGYPAALVADAGTVAADSTGVKTAAVGGTLVLQPGIYWMVAVSQSSTSTLRCHFPVPNVPIGLGTAATISGATLFGYTATGVTGALPSTWTSTVAASGALCPRVLWKFA